MRCLVIMAALMSVLVMLSAQVLGSRCAQLELPVPQHLLYYTTDWEWCEMDYDHYGNSGYPPSPNEHCEVIVKKRKIIINHIDAVYNCCIDTIDIQVSIQNNVITVYESEVYTQPCYCFCYFPTSVTITGVAPGNYTVEVWSNWMDGDEDLRCVEEITIPGM